MKKDKKLLYFLLCAVGGALIGFFANKLNTWIGILAFVIGVLLLVFSISKVNK